MNARGELYTYMGSDGDLLEYSPMLKVMKKKFPSYVKQAEDAQRVGRRFAREVIAPVALEVDAKCAEDPTYMDWDFYGKAMQEHIPTAYVPVKMGGRGWGGLGLFLFVEEGCAACVGLTAQIVFNMFGFLCACVDFLPGILISMIKEMVEEEAKGNPVFFGWAITEPSSGTDSEHPAAMRTMRPSIEAKRSNGGYLVNGRKHFITNGDLANYVVFNAPVDRSRPLETDATFFLDTKTPGFSIGRIENKCGHKAKHTAELVFEDVFLPEENVWAPPGQGMDHTLEILSTTRGAVAALALGNARGVTEATVRYASEKKVGGHRLIDEQWVQFELADIMKDVIIVRKAVIDFAVAVDFYHVMKMLNNPIAKTALRITPRSVLMSDKLEEIAGSKLVSSMVSGLKKKQVTDEVKSDFIRHGSAIKAAATDLALRAACVCSDIVGLEGMRREYGIEKRFRDAKVSQIYEGTNETNRLDVFEREVGYEF
jgi:acyl-CoA dehydrogenase